MDERLFVSTTEAAKLLGVSTVTVFKRIQKGEIKAQKVGRNYLIPRSEIQIREKTTPGKSLRPKNDFESLSLQIIKNPIRSISLREAKEISLSHQDLFTTDIDLGGRDIIIGFNEPAFKMSEEGKEPDLDSPLNARIISYFLPAVQIARQQKERPRLIVVSGINAALKWNARNDKERKTMVINNTLKMRFIVETLETFFPDIFSVIEQRAMYDFLKISDRKLELIWNVFERKYPERIHDLKKHLLRYKKPKLFSEEITENDIQKLVTLNEEELKETFKYAIVHLFGLGDVNLSYDFIHNPKGYCSIGEHHEEVFNVIRKIGYEILKDIGEAVFDQEVYCFDNAKIVIKDEGNAPPAYNGSFRGSNGVTRMDEVTFENNKDLEYYDARPRLKPSMDYMYRVIPKEIYEKYWKEYRGEYLLLKKRYKEAYKI